MVKSGTDGPPYMQSDSVDNNTVRIVVYEHSRKPCLERLFMTAYELLIDISVQTKKKEKKVGRLVIILQTKTAGKLQKSE